MMTATDALINLLANGEEFYICDLLTLTLVGGTVLRYASGDFDVTWGGQTFTPFRFDVDEIKQVRGLEVDDLVLQVYPRTYPYSAETETEEDLIGSLPWGMAARRGSLFEAAVQLEQAFFSGFPAGGAAGEPVGTLILFTGKIGPIEGGEADIQITAKSDLEILNRKLPRRLYQAGCVHTLFDPGCGLNRDDWAVAGVIQEGSTPSILQTDLAEADEYFTLGELEFTSGELTGVRSTVRQYVTGVVTLARFLDAAPAAGDEFIAWPGCGKSLAVCDVKFDNHENFLATPYVPPPETGV